MENVIEVLSEIDSIACSRAAIAMASALGFDRKGANEIAIAVSELATNAVKHGGGGSITLRAIGDPAPGVEVVARDDGPGIPDHEAVFEDGFSGGKVVTPDDRLGGKRNLGCGLGAVRRMMNTVSIESAPGKGTTVTARRFRGKPPGGS
jgi:serine/threonine-protein kinase RsbT